MKHDLEAKNDGVVDIKNTGEMSVEQAARYCGLSIKTLYCRISLGQGPRHLKRFGRLIFLAGDLEKWIEHNTSVVKAFSK